MIKILEIINREMIALGLDYSYMVNNKEQVTYPYLVGEYHENGHSFEDGNTNGTLILSCWNRGSDLSLLSLCETIKTHFERFTECSSGFSCYIAYENAQSVYTGEDELKKIEIYMSINYWEGE